MSLLEGMEFSVWAACGAGLATTLLTHKILLCFDENAPVTALPPAPVLPASIEPPTPEQAPVRARPGMPSAQQASRAERAAPPFAALLDIKLAALRELVAKSQEQVERIESLLLQAESTPEVRRMAL